MNYFELIRTHKELFNNFGAPLKIIKDKKIIEEWQKNEKLKLKQQGLPEDWADIGILFEDKYIMVVRDLVKNTKNEIYTYFRILQPNTLKGGCPVVILPILNKKILLLEHFRHATRTYHYEVPRGYSSLGVTAEENAQKELEEETGWKEEEMIPLGVFHPDTGSDGYSVQLFLAKLDPLKKPKRKPEKNIENIRKINFFSISIIENMICNGIITDSYTIGAYTRAKLKGLL